MHRSRVVSAAVVAFLAWVPVSASAEASAPPAKPESAIERWPLAVAIGGGLNTSGHLTAEATFLLDLPGPYVSVGYSHAGSGRRVFVEGGVNLIVSLAAGTGYHLDSTGASRWGFHLFAGVPVPLIGLGPDGASTPFRPPFHVAPFLLYVEPFYRPEFLRGAALEHELGLMLKVRIGLTKRQWCLPGFDAMAGIHDL